MITEMVVTLFAALCVVFTSLEGITLAQEKIRIAWAGASPANTFFHIGSLKIPFWWNSALSREAIVKAKRPLLLKFARAMIEAIHFNKTNKEEAKVIWGKNLRISDPEGLERAYQAYTSAFPDNLLPTPEGVKTLLDDLAPRDPKAAAADPKPFVDAGLVRELEASGFIKQLYKK